LRGRWDFVLLGDLVYWGLWEISKKKKAQETGLSNGALLGKLEQGSCHSAGVLRGEPEGGAIVLWTLQDM